MLKNLKLLKTVKKQITKYDISPSSLLNRTPQNEILPTPMTLYLECCRNLQYHVYDFYKLYNQSQIVELKALPHVLFWIFLLSLGHCESAIVLL